MKLSKETKKNIRVAHLVSQLTIMSRYISSKSLIKIGLQLLPEAYEVSLALHHSIAYQNTVRLFTLSIICQSIQLSTNTPCIWKQFHKPQ